MKKNIIYIFSSITIIAVCAYLVYEAIRIHQLADNGAKMSLATEKFESKISSNKKILILGDSLAFGVGASSPNSSFAGKIASNYEDSSIVNRAKIGETIHSLKETIENKLDNKFDKIFIIVGGNDIMRLHINIFDSANDLEHIVDKASYNSDEVILITTGNFSNVSLSPYVLKGLFNYRALLVREAALKLKNNYSNYNYIDFYALPVNSNEYKLYEAKDGYHLNDSGIERLLSYTLKNI